MRAEDTERLNAGLAQLDDIIRAFRRGNVSPYGVDGALDEIRAMLKILIEERQLALDATASEVSSKQRVAVERYAKRKDEGRTSRESVDGTSPQR